ncbi:MAG: GreA/GreB family elongation factor [Puniceicoccales bacterium]|jgi:transcription elongation GreA/GreB family factor|nr:GreA/GreB family elongation factor [Puniceicoccales bacterium]
MNDEVIELILADNPFLHRDREKLAAFRPGSYCFHKKFGYGRVISYDDSTGKLIINFKDKPGHGIDVVFAIKHLESLSSDHIVARYYDNPQEMEELLRKDHGRAVEIILEQFPDRRATQVVISEILSAIMDPKTLKVWWSKAKKAIEANSKLAIPETRLGYYVLRNQEIAPIDEFIDGVLMVRQTAKKLQYAAKLLDEANLENEQDKLVSVREELQRLIGSSSSTAAEKLMAWWMAQDLAERIPPPADEAESMVPLQEILKNDHAIAEVANALPAIKLNRLLTLVEVAFSERFQSVLIHLLRVGSLRTVGGVINFILSRNEPLLDLRKLLPQWVRDNSIKANLMEWVLKNRNNARYAAIIDNTVDASYFRMALILIDQESMRRSTNRKISLAEVIANDHSLAEMIASTESQEKIKSLAQMIIGNQGFDILTKRSIVAKFIRVYPSLQRLLEGGIGGDDSGKKLSESGILYVSQKSLDNIRREYEVLVTQKIPANKRAIEVAREEGDLKENSEYKMARQDQEILSARKAQIEKDLGRAQVVKYEEANTATVSIGSVVALKNDQGKTQRIAILGAWDGAPERSIIAYQTPLGRALLGKKVGDSVQLNRGEEQILSIDKWVDCANSW